jgi:hypothetical protein
MRAMFFLIVGVVILQSMNEPAAAQLVQVAPGYVKAPFVRVWNGPDGSSRVRAPFVDLYTPGYRRSYVGDGYVGGSYAKGNQYGRMDWTWLAEAVRSNLRRLDSDLSRFPSGDFWKTSLKTAEIASLVQSTGNGPPNEVTRRRLAEIAAAYDSVGNAAEVNRIVNLASFQSLRASLLEYATPAELRLRKQLSLSAADLNRALARFKTGPGWQQYLTLVPGGVLSTTELALSKPAPPLANLEDASNRFDSVAANEEFRVISEVREFGQTRQLLADYVAARRSQSPAVAPEELPRPSPDPQDSP